MNTKQIILGLIALVLVGAGGWYVMNNTAAPEPAVSNEEQEQVVDTTSFNSDELGVSFEYPTHYTLDTQAEGDTTTLVLIDSEILADYEQSGAMEGPPSITVQVIDNPQGLGIEEWITSDTRSNYQLATIQELLEGAVGGEPARAYEYSGLYNSNSVVVGYKGKIYVFTVGWLTEEDQNLSDFGNLLESVRFI